MDVVDAVTRDDLATRVLSLRRSCDSALAYRLLGAGARGVPVQGPSVRTSGEAIRPWRAQTVLDPESRRCGRVACGGRRTPA